ncbi:MAG TPA: APC family permease [Gemmatimonadales bacterium]|nr:APC family permease [Gemmatimonadales bacterium]
MSADAAREPLPSPIATSADASVQAKRGLRRVMGLSDVVLFFIAAVVGPRWIAVAAAAGPSSLVVWFIAGLTFFIPHAFTVIELSSRYPEQGGIYVWSKRAFGDFAGFLTGWMYWTSNLVYFPGLLYFAAGNALFIGGASWQALSGSATYFIIASLVMLAVAVGLNLIGLDVGKWLQNAGAFGTWIPVAILVVLGGFAWIHFGAAAPINPHTLAPSFRLKDLVFWSTLAFGFGGLESASLMSEEIHDARRTVPRAIVIAGVMIAAIYILGTLAIVLALPPGEATGLQGIMQAVQQTARRGGVAGIAPVVALLITIGSIGGVGAWTASTARLPFVAGIDSYLPPVFGRLHPKWATPYVAMLVQAVVAGCFAVLGQAGASVKNAYDFLVSMGVISFFIPYLFMFASLIRVQSVPAPPGTQRVPGGSGVARVLGGLGFLVTAGSIVLSFIPAADDPHPTLTVVKIAVATSIVVGTGALLYARGRRHV